MTASLTPTRDAAWLLKESGPLVTPTAGREVSGLDRLTFNRIIDEGILPTVSIGGGRVRIPRSALLRYLGITGPDAGAA